MLHSEGAALIFLTFLLVSVHFTTTPEPLVNAQQEMVPTQTFENQEQYDRIAFSADGKHIVAMSKAKATLSLFNRTRMLWTTPVADIRSIAMSEDASLIVAAATSGLYLFGTQNPNPQLHYELSCANPLVALSNDGNTLACAATFTDPLGTASTILYLFDTRNQNPTWHTSLQGTFESLSISGDGNYTAITTTRPGALHLFSKQSTPLWTYNLGERGGAAKLSSDGNYIIATGGNQTNEHGLRVYRFHSQSPKPNYIKTISEMPPTQRLSVSSQGSLFALGLAESNRLIFFNLNLPPYGYGPGSVLNISLPARPTSTAMSFEGEYTAVATQAGIYVYEYVNNELSLRKQYTKGNPLVADIAITPSGWYLAATTAVQNSQHGTISLFNVVEIRNGDMHFWFRMTFLVIIILAVSATSVFILRRRHKPQKPASTN